MSEENRVKLQNDILSKWWRERGHVGPKIRVLVKDGFAEFYDGDNMTRRKLSEKGREYIRTDGVWMDGEEESFLEPEDSKQPFASRPPVV